jgi:phosphohistidine phosphatase SixA
MRYPLLSVILLIISATPVAHAQEAIFLIRHAEQVLDVEDPPLTQEGQQRAKTWGTILRDAGIKVIYTSKKARTKQTGEHIAQALTIPLESVPRKEVAHLVNQIRTRHAGGRVLIVTHSRQMPKIFKQLGLTADVSEKATFSRDEYDNLFIVVSVGEDEATILRLRY